MKRDELRALGVPENAVDQVYELCRKHMAKLITNDIFLCKGVQRVWPQRSIKRK